MKYIIFFIFFFVNFNYSQILSKKNIDVNVLNENKAKELSLLAVDFFKKNDLKKSTELLFRAKYLAETTNNYELIVKINGSIAHQYIHLELFEKAEEYLKTVIDFSDKIENEDVKKMVKSLTFLEYGNISFDNNNFKDAKIKYSRALFWINSSLNSEKSDYHKKRVLYNIGKTYLHLNVIDSSNYYLKKSLQSNISNESEIDLYIKNTQSQLFFKQKNHDQSISLLLDLLHDKKLSDYKLKSEILYYLSINYKALSNEKLYLFYLEEHTILDNLIKKNKLEAINRAISAEQNNYKIDKIKLNSNIKLLVIFIIIIILAFLIIIFYSHYIKKKEIEKFEKIIKKLTINPIINPEKNKIKYKPINSPTSIESEILEKLLKFEKTNKFTNPNLNISSLAVQFKTNVNYLSDVINKYKGKNFNSYINELRINFICEKLYNDKEFQKYKISYLAECSGFSSHSAFATVFKNITGIPPSTFIREAAKKSI